MANGEPAAGEGGVDQIGSLVALYSGVPVVQFFTHGF
jgi:hypothetical protein